jgi:hypothetical protein
MNFQRKGETPTAGEQWFSIFHTWACKLLKLVYNTISFLIGNTEKLDVNHM